MFLYYKALTKKIKNNLVILKYLFFISFLFVNFFINAFNSYSHFCANPVGAHNIFKIIIVWAHLCIEVTHYYFDTG